MRYPIPEYFHNISEKKEALEYLAVLLEHDDLVYEWEGSLNKEDFFDNILVFCDKWNIPFSVDLWKEILSRKEKNEEDREWSSSQC